MSALLQDVRYTARSLPRSIGFTVAAVLTLALGIGANTAIFSVVNSVLIQPLPFRQPDRLVRVWGNTGGTGAEFTGIRNRSRSYDQVAAYGRGSGFTLTGRGEPERIDGVAGTSSLFTVLGVSPALGRGFAVGEDQPGRDHVIVLSDGLWHQRFGADPHIVGTTVTVDAIPRVVIGVMPADFHFPARSTQAWVPLVIDPHDVGNFWGSGGSIIIGRLRAGVTPAQAQAEIPSIARQLRHNNPLWDAGVGYGANATVVPLQKEASGDVRPTLLLLVTAVAVVLLIACANVANLLLARGAAQSRAYAIRTALGARRKRLIQQLLTESLVLSALGAAAGFVIAWIVVAPLAGGLLADTPQLASIGIDGRVLAFTIIVAMVTGVLTGLVPALRTSDPNLQLLLNDAGRGASGGVGHRRLSDALVTVEIALAVMLVIGAGLLIRSFWELQHVDPGFNPAGVTSARIDLPTQVYANDTTKRAFYTDLLQRVAAQPGVTSVAAGNHLPLGGDPSSLAFRVQGQFEDIQHGLPMAGGYHVITSGYLRTMGIQLRKGRAFTDADGAGAPSVVLVNEALAHHFWPNGNAIGQRIGYPWPSNWLTIVGIIGSVTERSIGAPDTTMVIYRPFLQAPSAAMTVLVKSDAPTSAIVAGLRTAVASVDRSVPLSHVQTMEDVISSSVAKPRFTMLLLCAFAGVALLLGAIGIYGVVSYSVTQRSREIGIRMALGAKRNDVLRLVIHRGAILASAGAIAGLLLSFAAMRGLASLLYGVTVADPATFIAAPVLLVGVALLASYIPARRAALVDPVTVLNVE